MTDHAGSASTPYLSTALLIATEGILRETPAKGVTLPATSRAADSLETMNPIFRRLIFIDALNRGVTVEFGKTADTASLQVNGIDFATLTAPKAGANLDFQLNQILVAKDLRVERMPEIVIQQTDVLSFFGAMQQLNVVSQPWMLETLRSVLEAAMAMVAQMKYALPVPRPVRMWENIAPVIQTPQHSSFPSGHAAEGFAACYVLSRLNGLSDAAALDQKNPIFNMAARVAVNRTVAGVHYPMDSMAGALMGITLGRIYWQRLEATSQAIDTFNVDGNALLTQDFHAEALAAEISEQQTTQDLTVTASEELSWLRGKAAGEAGKNGGGVN